MKENNKKKVTPLLVASRLIVAVCFLFMMVALLRFSVKNFFIDRGYGDSETLQKMYNGN